MGRFGGQIGLADPTLFGFASAAIEQMRQELLAKAVLGSSFDAMKAALLRDGR